MSFLGSVFGANTQPAYQSISAQQVAPSWTPESPSVANQFFKNANEQAIANANSMAASARGNVNPALAERNAQQAAAQTQAINAGQGAAARNQEELQGMQLNQQAALANQQANLAAQLGTAKNAQAGVNQQEGIISGIGQGLMGLGKSIFGFAHGGQIPHYAGGGDIAGSFVSQYLNAPDDTSGLNSLKNSIGTGFGIKPSAPAASSSSKASTAPNPSSAPGNSSPLLGLNYSQPANQMFGVSSGPQLTSLAGLAKGGKIPVLVSPDERYLPPKEAEKVAKGLKDGNKAGEKIKGKAKVPGDSLKNDIVPKTLKSGGVVVPRSIAMTHDPHKIHSFVAAVMAKSGRHLKSA